MTIFLPGRFILHNPVWLAGSDVWFIPVNRPFDHMEYSNVYMFGYDKYVYEIIRYEIWNFFHIFRFISSESCDMIN